MGNRAVVVFEKEHNNNSIGVYLHYNGGPESVLAFAQACVVYDVSSYRADPIYSVARFAQIVGNFFGGVGACGVGRLSEMDCENGQNGMLFVDWSSSPLKIARKSGRSAEWHDLDPDEIRKHDYWAPAKDGGEPEILAQIFTANDAAFKRR